MPKVEYILNNHKRDKNPSAKVIRMQDVLTMNRKMTTASKTDYSTKTHPSHSTDKLLNETMKFFLENITTELSQEIDWRARGYGKNIIIKTGIYMPHF